MPKRVSSFIVNLFLDQGNKHSSPVKSCFFALLSRVYTPGIYWYTVHEHLLQNITLAYVTARNFNFVTNAKPRFKSTRNGTRNFEQSQIKRSLPLHDFTTLMDVGTTLESSTYFYFGICTLANCYYSRECCFSQFSRCDANCSNAKIAKA